MNDDSDKLALLEAILAVKGDPKRSAQRFRISLRSLGPNVDDWTIHVYDTVKRRYTADVVVASSPKVNLWLTEHKLL